MSTIYASGSESAAINGTVTAIRQFLSTDAAGATVLNVEGLTGWLRQQFNSMATTDNIQEGDRSGVTMRAAQVDVGAMAAQLANQFKPDYWKYKSGYPSSTAGVFSVANLKASMANLKTHSTAISDYFTSLMTDQKLLALATGSYGDSGATLPEVVTRVVVPLCVIQTFVTDWGEESMPSKPSEVKECDQNDEATIMLAAPAPNRNITKWRLYAANSGNQAAAFQFVDEGSAGQVSYDLKKKATEWQEVCPTNTWAEPPEKLRGLVGMPNGIMAGFYENSVAFCEPYKGYAWPVDYQRTVEHAIVGLGVFDNTLFVGTIGNPYFIEGVDSASMAVRKLNFNQACVSAQSIVGVTGGVVYASPDGLCLASPRGVEVITGSHFTREDWQRINPASIVAAEHEGAYYFTYSGGSAGSGCYALHPATGKLARVEAQGSAMWVDRLTDTLYIASGRAITAMFQSADRRQAVATTKVIRMESQAALAWLAVVSDFTNSVRVTIEADGKMWHDVTLTTMSPVRLPPGRHLEYVVTISSQARVQSLTMASSTVELQGVP